MVCFWPLAGSAFKVRYVKISVITRAEGKIDNTYRDLDNSGYHKKTNSITVLLYIPFSSITLSTTMICRTKQRLVLKKPQSKRFKISQ